MSASLSLIVNSARAHASRNGLQWLHMHAHDRTTGFLGSLQRENEAMLHTGSAADPRWQRGAYVCTRTNPPPNAVGTPFWSSCCSCGRKLLPCATSATNPDSRLEVHVSLLRCDEALVTVTCNYLVPWSCPVFLVIGRLVPLSNLCCKSYFARYSRQTSAVALAFTPITFTAHRTLIPAHATADGATRCELRTALV